MKTRLIIQLLLNLKAAFTAESHKAFKGRKKVMKQSIAPPLAAALYCQTRRRGIARPWLAMAAVLLSMAFVPPVRAGTPTVAVIYPEVREPYNAVFMEIIRGIEAELKQSVKPYVIDDAEGAAALAERMKEDGIDAVVSLGQAGLSAAKPLSEKFPVVIGAVFVSASQDTKGLSGISLVPDPYVLFDRLKELVPEAKEITVIFDPSQKSWEIARAKDAANTRGLALKALPAEDARQSALLFRDILVQARGDSIAIWLPQSNAAVDEQSMLPLVLKEAWDRSFVVFSSNLDHVRKGALFSLYPDNFRMGRSLATMALGRLHSAEQQQGIQPLRDLLIAVNLRTAEHLGLNLASNAKRRFDLTFPQQ